jgi:F-type H+-transporting ATPase subunit b
MDATLQALAGFLIKSIPTIVFFVFLAVFLNQVFFKPMARVLEERRRQTEGVRQLAQQALEAVDRKTSEFEHALQLARIQINQENEALRRKWSEEQMDSIAHIREEASKQIEEAKRQIAQEVEKAKGELDLSVDQLSSHIVESLLKRRAA